MCHRIVWFYIQYLHWNRSTKFVFKKLVYLCLFSQPWPSAIDRRVQFSCLLKYQEEAVHPIHY